MTNIYKTTTFVSLYQASENIYDQFDKVLVIDSGRQIYFGSTEKARGYFEGLGFATRLRQTTPDYLTGCTDEFERNYAPGRNPATVPSTPEALENTFRHSAIWTELNKEMEAYREDINTGTQAQENFVSAFEEYKSSYTSKNSVYTVNYTRQIWALVQRQFLLKWQDKVGLAVSWITAMMISIVTGTIYFNQPTTSAGAFTRGGLLFVALLYNTFDAFSEMAGTIANRSIINKHKAFTFHRPSALWIAQALVDLIFASVQIFVFSIIVYFMSNLVRDVGTFFTFYLVILLIYVTMNLTFRTIGFLSKDFDVALKFGSILITLFILTCGYLVCFSQ